MLSVAGAFVVVATAAQPSQNTLGLIHHHPHSLAHHTKALILHAASGCTTTQPSTPHNIHNALHPIPGADKSVSNEPELPSTLTLTCNGRVSVLPRAFVFQTICVLFNGRLLSAHFCQHVSPLSLVDFSLSSVCFELTT